MPEFTESQEVDTGEGLLDERGEVDLGFSRSTVAGAARGGFLNRGDDAGMGVTGDQRAPGGQVVDITIVVDVPDGGTARAGDEARRAADGAERAHGRVDPTGQVALRFGEEGLRAYGFPWNARDVHLVLTGAPFRAGAVAAALSCVSQRATSLA